MSNRMDSKLVKIAEDKGRAKFEAFLKSKGITEYEFNEDEFGVYDCTFKDNSGRLILTEIKNRSKRYENYDDMLIEKKKYDSLRELTKPFLPELIASVYVNVYEDSNKIKVSGALENMNLEFFAENHQMSDLGNRNLIQKLVGFIKNFRNYTI